MQHRLGRGALTVARLKRKDIPYRVWMRLVDAAGWKCAKCSVALSVTVSDGRHVQSSKVFPHIDHIVPLAKGGADDESNYQVLCADCNRRKGAR